jgi:hypothetical protein
MKLKPGDIFTIPISEEKSGFGQIIFIPNKNNFIIEVFEKVYTGHEWPSLKEIINDKILFFGYTMDALLYHKYWKIIGNDSSNLKKIKLPFYKLGTAPDYKLVDYRGKVIGKINGDKFEKLSYQEIIAPIRYENALKAYYGLEEWRKDYDELLYQNVLTSIEVVEGR